MPTQPCVEKNLTATSEESTGWAFKAASRENLLEAMDQRMLLLRKRSMILVDTLDRGDEDAAPRQLDLYMSALKSHLEFVGRELYVHLRNQLDETPQRQSVVNFEAETKVLISKIVNQLVKCRQSSARHKMLFAEPLSAANVSLVRRYEEEKAFLYPMR